jgi:CheY-like chemotaxis protein
MNGILGMTELALETALTAEQRDYLSMVKSSAEALLVVLNDILDFSKIEAGKLDLSPVEVSLREFLSDTLKPLAFRARSKGLELAWHAIDAVPDVVLADPVRLRQVLNNLAGNSLKFTSRGGVTVAVSLAGEDESGCLARFEVRDTGIGIPEDKLATIFAPFEQADGSTTRKYGGTGLGLSISKALVEMMGGQIGVISNAGAGSTFWFTARLRRGTARVQEERPAEAVARPLRILLTEDNPVNQKLAVRLLEKQGHTVSVAGTGREAVRACAAEAFDVVLMDLQMPDMGGIEATRLIRASGCRVPIVALTAHAMKGDRERCLEAGMDDYLTKPVRPKELAEALAAVSLERPAPHPGRV